MSERLPDRVWAYGIDETVFLTRSKSLAEDHKVHMTYIPIAEVEKVLDRYTKNVDLDESTATKYKNLLIDLKKLLNQEGGE